MAGSEAHRSRHPRWLATATFPSSAADKGPAEERRGKELEEVPLHVRGSRLDPVELERLERTAPLPIVLAVRAQRCERHEPIRIPNSHPDAPEGTRGAHAQCDRENGVERESRRRPESFERGSFHPDPP